MLLEVNGLCVNYGHIEAIRDISFGVEEGTITTLIGANGAGKTTTLKTLSGLRKVRAGTVTFAQGDAVPAGQVCPVPAPPSGLSGTSFGTAPAGGKAIIGALKVVNLTNPFIPGTTLHSATGVTDTYFNFTTHPGVSI